MGTFSALVPAGIAVLCIALAVFGGMSYGIYHTGANWGGLGFFIGLIGAFALLVASLRNFFGKLSGRMMFCMWLIGILGAYGLFLFQGDRYPMGIDLAGGSELIYRLDYSQTERNIADAQNALKTALQTDPDSQKTRALEGQVNALIQSKNSAPEKAAEIVRKRVDPTGTKGIPVTTLGSDKQRLRIQLPKANQDEVNRVKEAVQKQGRLTFHIVANDQETISKTKANKATTRTYTDPKTNVEYEYMEIKKMKQFTEKASEELQADEIVVKRVPDMDGSTIVYAQASHSSEGAGYEIQVRFGPAGASQFYEMTNANKGRRMAIVLDNVAYSAPTIQEAIAENCRISGNFDKAESEKLASILQAGSLPAEVKFENEFTVGPTLGREQIHSGMMATAIGTGAVIVFMIIYYGLSGAIASFCTMMTVLMLLGAMGFFKATLTLPGIAGIVLTLGMSVDANVLILERLREELQRGRNLRLAVSHAFDRAFLTIIDCHITTIISGVVLYYLGTGPVRGFAVSLTIGIITTLFCNLWLNWLIMEWIVNRDGVKNFSMMQFFKSTNIDFMGWRKVWMTATASLAVLSLILLGVFSNRLYDVDFTGGTLIQFNMAQGKAMADDEAKKIVEEKLKPAVKQQSQELIGKLKEALATGKKGPELNNILAQKDPILGDIGKASGADPESVQAAIDTIQRDIENFDLTTQAAGAAPVAGKYSGYTVTTRATDPHIIELLSRQIKTVFAGNLEPDAVTAADDSLMIRFEPTANADDIKKHIEEKKNDLARDAAKPEVKDALAAIAVKEVKSAEGYQLAYLSPLPKDAELRSQVVTAVEAMPLKERAGGPISRKNSFGSQVADELKWQALGALIVANLGVFIYLWFRFEFSGSWGFGAIVALVHDVIIAAGGVVIANLFHQATGLGFPLLIDLNIVAALLTIVGFSVNDTIVVFDRIREVKHAHPTRTLEEIVNEAINATLSRTVLTSATVIIADLALLIFGGPTIKGLAWTLFVGFSVGTYSSIFIASPLMIWWHKRFGEGVVAAPAAKPARAADAAGAEV